ncbi:MAG: hypothetical protein IGR93_05135 [Hydrococcus sp. C42_A2020_068]|nr:hypothetical protein [Hydrococcus sp. C42_A2020_068]
MCKLDVQETIGANEILSKKIFYQNRQSSNRINDSIVSRRAIVAGASANRLTRHENQRKISIVKSRDLAFSGIGALIATTAIKHLCKIGQKHGKAIA